MEPRIVERPGFKVMGIVETCRFAEPDFFPRLWRERFGPNERRIQPLSPDKGYYALYFCAGDQGIKVLAGMAVENVGDAPEGLVVKEVPPARYALFETSMKEITQTWKDLNERWLQESGYERASSPDFEYYPPDNETGEKPILIGIPIQERARG